MKGRENEVAVRDQKKKKKGREEKKERRVGQKQRSTKRSREKNSVYQRQNEICYRLRRSTYSFCFGRVGLVNELSLLSIDNLLWGCGWALVDVIEVIPTFGSFIR